MSKDRQFIATVLRSLAPRSRGVAKSPRCKQPVTEDSANGLLASCLFWISRFKGLKSAASFLAAFSFPVLAGPTGIPPDQQIPWRQRRLEAHDRRAAAMLRSCGSRPSRLPMLSQRPMLGWRQQPRIQAAPALRQLCLNSQLPHVRSPCPASAVAIPPACPLRADSAGFGLSQSHFAPLAVLSVSLGDASH